MRIFFASSVEEQLLRDLGAMKAERDAANKRAEENKYYRSLYENRINRNAKDSVFLNLFSIPEYQMKLYQELFPEDTSIKPEDLEHYTLGRILTNHPYNDLGLLVRKKLIVLSEAASRWSVNNIYRLAGYYFDTVEQFVERSGMNVHAKAKIELLDVEAFVIYPGPDRIDKDVISLRDEFFGGNPDKPDFKARIIYGDFKEGIISEYMGFCRVLDEQRHIHKNDPTPEKWIDVTIEECIEKGYLAKYLKDRRSEVQQIMFEMYNPEYVKEKEMLSRAYETYIIALRDVGASDEQIEGLLVKRYGITSQYAKNLVECDYNDENDVMAV